MKTLNKSLAVQLREELRERYGLRDDQVHLEVKFYTTDLEQGRQILSDFENKHSDSKEFFSGENDPCDHVYSTEIFTVGVHRKDGFYGMYVTKHDEENE